jgi:hypothetical protein
LPVYEEYLAGLTKSAPVFAGGDTHQLASEQSTQFFAALQSGEMKNGCRHPHMESEFRSVPRSKDNRGYWGYADCGGYRSSGSNGRHETGFSARWLTAQTKWSRGSPVECRVGRES